MRTCGMSLSLELRLSEPESADSAWALICWLRLSLDLLNYFIALANCLLLLGSFVVLVLCVAEVPQQSRCVPQHNSYACRSCRLNFCTMHLCTIWQRPAFWCVCAACRHYFQQVLDPDSRCVPLRWAGIIQAIVSQTAYQTSIFMAV